MGCAAAFLEWVLPHWLSEYSLPFQKDIHNVEINLGGFANLILALLKNSVSATENVPALH